MNQSNLIVQIVSFLSYWLLQVFFMRHIALFDVAFCLFYVGFLLVLPFSTPPFLLMLLGFLLGFLTDLFYDTIGMHAAACVFLAFMRPYVINILRPSGGYESSMSPTWHSMGWRWFFLYAGILLFLHHSLLFFIHSGSIEIWLLTTLRIFASLLVSLLTIFSLQILFYRT
ncbi:MAG: Rod shape-determining protein MreD [Bernardetiaceae bacterium]|nr:Rod shape-determining protein MreD [Bernardetiaceae bacterium]